MKYLNSYYGKWLLQFVYSVLLNTIYFSSMVWPVLMSKARQPVKLSCLYFFRRTDLLSVIHLGPVRGQLQGRGELKHAVVILYVFSSRLKMKCELGVKVVKRQRQSVFPGIPFASGVTDVLAVDAATGHVARHRHGLLWKGLYRDFNFQTHLSQSHKRVGEHPCCRNS